MSSLAWTTLVLTALTGLLLALPTVALFMAPPTALRDALTVALGVSRLPPEAELALTIARPVFAGLLAAVLGIFVASLALLKRRPWARVCFQGLLGSNIVLNVVVVAFPALLPPGRLPALPPAVRGLLAGSSLALAVVFSALCAWCMWRLASPDVRREFGGDRTGRINASARA